MGCVPRVIHEAIEKERNTSLKNHGRFGVAAAVGQTRYKGQPLEVAELKQKCRI